jgi:hypothetical protein
MALPLCEAAVAATAVLAMVAGAAAGGTTGMGGGEGELPIKKLIESSYHGFIHNRAKPIVFQ